MLSRMKPRQHARAPAAAAEHAEVADGLFMMKVPAGRDL
jgi:hypothetical protein